MDVVYIYISTYIHILHIHVITLGSLSHLYGLGSEKKGSLHVQYIYIHIYET